MSEKETDDLLPIRVGSIDPTAITAQISLPAAVWERLTADLRDDDRMSLGRPELPDVPLHVRIWQFLDLATMSWEDSVTEPPVYPGNGSDDLDDLLPF
ncbi:hypothetical protein [Croceibacterium ferulae]|uniref:hypothetical protein n=1 Tax=Croceibacterium ferulae TaxID=1854641 RepID=UPI000EB57790|nr:hypothetical protein [Croceibacterium ferulae]